LVSGGHSLQVCINQSLTTMSRESGAGSVWFVWWCMHWWWLSGAHVPASCSPRSCLRFIFFKFVVTLWRSSTFLVWLLFHSQQWSTGVFTKEHESNMQKKLASKMCTNCKENKKGCICTN